MTTNLGKKYVCYSCQTKYYDLGKAQPVCPKCGANPRDEDHAAPVTRGRRAPVVVEPEDDAFEEPADEPAADEEEETLDEPDTPDAKDDDDDDEEEE